MCISLMVKPCNMDKLEHFLLKMTFYPLWPQMTPGERLDP